MTPDDGAMGCHWLRGLFDAVQSLDFTLEALWSEECVRGRLDGAVRHIA